MTGQTGVCSQVNIAVPTSQCSDITMGFPPVGSEEHGCRGDLLQAVAADRKGEEGQGDEAEDSRKEGNHSVCHGCLQIGSCTGFASQVDYFERAQRVVELQQNLVEKEYEKQLAADKEFHQQRETDKVGIMWSVWGSMITVPLDVVCRSRLLRRRGRRPWKQVLALH